jgi:Zn-dependent protease
MSVQIGKISGIPIRLHFTLIIAFFLISWTLATSLMPFYFPDLAPESYWLMGVLGSVVLFFSVLLHELAHSILATRYGVKVREIVLFLFGGVSNITAELKDYRQELKMALAGPLTSFAISAAFALAWWLVASVLGVSPAWKVAEGVFFYGAMVNAILGAFNLIPAFPSDGGRVLRAILVRRKKDYNEATKAAARVGIAISYAIMGVGFLVILAGSFLAGVWVLLIGWFLMSGAQSYLTQIEVSSILSRTRLQDIMNTNVISVKPDLVASQLIENFFRKYMKSTFPVVDEQGRLLGAVTLKSVLEIPEDKRDAITAAEAMVLTEDLVVMGPDEKADGALAKMTGKRTGKVLVCDSQGRLVGLVSKTDILNVEMERHEYAEALGRSSST